MASNWAIEIQRECVESALKGGIEVCDIHTDLYLAVLHGELWVPELEADIDCGAGGRHLRSGAMLCKVSRDRFGVQQKVSQAGAFNALHTLWHFQCIRRRVICSPGAVELARHSVTLSGATAHEQCGARTAYSLQACTGHMCQKPKQKHSTLNSVKSKPTPAQAQTPAAPRQAQHPAPQRTEHIGIGRPFCL